MFDEDEDASLHLGDVIAHYLSQIPEGEYLIPFDCQNIKTSDPLLFGHLGRGDMIGRNARFKGGSIIDYDTKATIDSDEMIGTLVGHDHDRVVLAFETDEGVSFLGWLSLSDIDLIQVFIPESQKWLH